MEPISLLLHALLMGLCMWPCHLVQSTAALNIDLKQFQAKSFFTNAECVSTPGRIDVVPIIGEGGNASDACAEAGCRQPPPDEETFNPNYWYTYVCPLQRSPSYVMNAMQGLPFALFHRAVGNTCASRADSEYTILQINNKCHHGYQAWFMTDDILVLRLYNKDSCTGSFRDLEYKWSEEDQTACEDSRQGVWIQLISVQGVSVKEVAETSEMEQPIAGVIIAAVASIALVLLTGWLSLLWLKRRRQTFSTSARLETFLPPLHNEKKSDNSGKHLTSPTVCYTQLSEDRWTNHSSASGKIGWSTTAFRELRIPTQELRDLSKLGKDEFGPIWLVEYERENRKLVSRRLHVKEESIAQAFLAVIHQNAALSHPSIVSFVGVAWTSGHDLQALFEHMEGGDLRSWLRKTDAQWSQTKIQVAVDIAEALEYLHSRRQKVMHRNIRPESVFLDVNVRAKLGNLAVHNVAPSWSEMVDGTKLLYLAPEVLMGSGQYDEFSDMYSFGVLLSELDTHNTPYWDLKISSPIQLVHLVTSGSATPAFTATCPPGIMTLAQSCLNLDARQRPNAQQARVTLIRLMREWQ